MTSTADGCLQTIIRNVGIIYADPPEHGPSANVPRGGRWLFPQETLMSQGFPTTPTAYGYPDCGFAYRRLVGLCKCSNTESGQPSQPDIPPSLLFLTSFSSGLNMPKQMDTHSSNLNLLLGVVMYVLIVRTTRGASDVFVLVDFG